MHAVRIKTFFTHKTCILAALVRETGLFTHAISTLITTLTQNPAVNQKTFFLETVGTNCFR